jgi:hypothetical protein
VKVVFKSSDPTVEEWTQLFHVLYADGGMFAARLTYLEFLNQRFSPNSDNEQAARLAELAAFGEGSMPRTQEKMRRLLECAATTAGAGGQPKQIDFTL